MSFDLIIKNGTVILENEARVVDIAVKGGKIAAIGQDLGDAKEVMDASGLVVSPGMVDAHTHISEPGRSHWEELKFDAAKGKLTIDAAQLGGLVSYNIDRLHELDEVGVVGFKCFVATCGDRGIDNDFRDVNDWQFFKGAQKLGELGQPVLVHCENALICDALGEEAKSEGRVPMTMWLRVRYLPKWKRFAAYCTWRKLPVAVCTFAISAAQKVLKK